MVEWVPTDVSYGAGEKALVERRAIFPAMWREIIQENLKQCFHFFPSLYAQPSDFAVPFMKKWNLFL